MITLILIGLVGGLITGISPCVLPVLPVIFFSAGAGSGNRRPYLIVAGLALSFSVFTLLGTLIVSALPIPDDTIRWAGLIVLVLLGISMLIPQLDALLERPFARIPQRRVGDEHSGFVLGLALGAVYVPCAGPVLAAITVAGATGRIGAETVGLTVAFAVGTAIPLLIFALAGRGVAERVRAFRGRQRRVRIVAGVVVIGLAVALTFNVTDFLQRDVPDYTASINDALNRAGALHPGQSGDLARCVQYPDSVPQECGRAPQIGGIDKWLNTPDGKPASTKGKVVLVDFWAYSCINCQRAIPHVSAWYSDYRSDGFQVIGVHTPEYAFEHVAKNVAAGGKRLGIKYPVALDNAYTTWNNFGNQSWPAEYLIDATGKIRHVAIGEGDYDGTEAVIRTLLKAAHPGRSLPPPTHVTDTTPRSPLQTPETYLGAARAQNYASGVLPEGTHSFEFPGDLPSDRFALRGRWSVDDEAITAGKDAAIGLNYQADDVYLDVGGTGTITATVDGKSRSYHVSGAPNIYTLVHRDKSERGQLTVMLSPGLQAYSFTFG
ncbi:MAG TPA: cytochrome c biogenesis protein CcdA [Mycobacteriales bacterium]|nr:cytochrome c biogenesis protein CcdA [Mycobacteriales bacterium]